MFRDMIKISATLTLSNQVPGNDQFANDSLGSPFGDIQGNGNIPQTNARIPRNQKKRIAMTC